MTLRCDVRQFVVKELAGCGNRLDFHEVDTVINKRVADGCRCRPFGYQIRQFAEALLSPSVLHSSALMFPSTSAPSASSATISSMMDSGLRCMTASPRLGFFTDRSKVTGSTLLTSTLQLFDESVKVPCSFTNSARSSSLSGFVLPRLRPGSS